MIGSIARKIFGSANDRKKKKQYKRVKNYVFVSAITLAGAKIAVASETLS